MWDSRKLLSMLEFVAKGYEPPGEVALYAMGGTAMTLLGLKTSTEDVDFLVSDEAERFISALRYSNTFRLKGTFPMRSGAVVVESLDGERMDLYVGRVFEIRFTPSMRDRSSLVADLGWLKARSLSAEDIVLMKLYSGRDKDRADLEEIVAHFPVDWSVIEGELGGQQEQVGTVVRERMREWNLRPSAQPRSVDG